jgi:hypothetical protein
MDTTTVEITQAQWELYEAFCRQYADELRNRVKGDVVLTLNGRPVCLSIFDTQATHAT